MWKNICKSTSFDQTQESQTSERKKNPTPVQSVVMKEVIFTIRISSNTNKTVKQNFQNLPTDTHARYAKPSLELITTGKITTTFALESNQRDLKASRLSTNAIMMIVNSFQEEKSSLGT